MNIKIKGAPQELIHEISMETEIVTIGRSPDNDFVVPLEDFSRKHCKLTFKGEYAYIQDLGSKNGVLLDGKRITPHQQYPVYSFTTIILANKFQLLLPQSRIRNEDSEISLKLDMASKKL